MCICSRNKALTLTDLQESSRRRRHDAVVSASAVFSTCQATPPPFFLFFFFKTLNIDNNSVIWRHRDATKNNL